MVLEALQVLAAVGVLGGQGAEPPAQPPGEAPPARREIAFEDLPPASRLGLRAEQMRRQSEVVPQVVIVPDGHSYLEAIAAWTPELRYPVLIDDGELESREHIARFVRAFEPERVVRWRYEPAMDEPRPGRRNMRELATAAVARAWDVEYEEGAAAPAITEALVEHWRDDPAAMPGVVATGVGDDAWTAAVALAALRAQPIVWVTVGQNVSGTSGAASIEAIDALLQEACVGLGLAHEAIGDRIDAVTLCLHVSSKFRLDRDEIRATSDRVGRTSSEGDGRWAWSSQIFGSEARSAYQAMSAYFLSPEKAWLFDTYPTGEPWSEYSVLPAATALQDAGLEVDVAHAPRNRRTDWFRAAGRVVDADIVLVNSKGLRSYFEFGDGRAYAGDIPLLGRPALVHFIHSWSAVQPAAMHTIGARWLQRGAYAYAGAVDEPYLQAFLPPRAIVARLRMAFPWAAAARHDRAPLWKIGLFGDPLATAGPAGERSDEPLGLEGAEDLSERLASAVGQKDYPRVFELLALLGRDEQAARLARALLEQEGDSVTEEVAQAAMFAVARAGPPQTLVELYGRMAEAAQEDPQRRDALWARSRLLLPAVGVRESDDLLDLLRRNLRTDQFGTDASDLAAAIARAEDAVAAVSFLTRLEPPNGREQTRIDRALRKWREAAGLR